MVNTHKVNYLSKYLIEEAAAISSSAKNLDDKEVSKALNLLDNCYKNKLKVIIKYDTSQHNPIMNFKWKKKNHF